MGAAGTILGDDRVSRAAPAVFSTARVSFRRAGGQHVRPNGGRLPAQGAVAPGFGCDLQWPVLPATPTARRNLAADTLVAENRLGTLRARGACVEFLDQIGDPARRRMLARARKSG
jgi:hypothetical protein